MITIALLLGGLAGTARGDGADLPREAVVRIEQAARAAASELDALVLLVAVDDELAYVRGWGSLDEEGRPAAGADSAFRAGALHSQLTALVAMQLAAVGRLDLDAEVGELFPPLAGSASGVTLEHLLEQSSGLPPLEDLGRAPAERGALLAILAGAPRESDPGECFQLSSTNDVLVGWAIEDVLGSPLPEVFEERVFQPLGMAGTRYRGNGPPLDEYADAYQVVRGELVSTAGVERYFSAGALCTTAGDLLRLHRALVTGGVVEARTFERMIRSARLHDGRPTGHGIGFETSSLGGLARVLYGGGLSGGHLCASWYPEAALSVLVLARADSARLGGLEQAVARAVLDLPEPRRSDLPTTEELRGRYRGAFYVGCDRLTVDEDGESLFFDGPGWSRTRLLYQGGDVFLGEDSELRLEFVLEHGLAVALRLTAGGVELRAVRGS